MGSSLASKSNCLSSFSLGKKNRHVGVFLVWIQTQMGLNGVTSHLLPVLDRSSKKQLAKFLLACLLMQPRDHFGKESLNQMPNLHSVRVGWCNVQGNPTGTLQIAAEALCFFSTPRLKKLRKLFLSFNELPGDPAPAHEVLEVCDRQDCCPPKKFPAKTRQQILMPLTIF